MEIIGDLLKILLPAGAVLYGMFVTTKNFLQKDFDRRLVELRIRNTDIVLPLRLQAYERMCLFLERIAPNNLLRRVNRNGVFTVGELHSLLLNEIREEYGHNLSQQIYMSDAAWMAIRTAMEEVVVYINSAASGIAKEAPSIELGKAIFETLIQHSADPTGKALQFIKTEIRQVF
jgi:hypothetical protein